MQGAWGRNKVVWEWGECETECEFKMSDCVPRIGACCNLSLSHTHTHSLSLSHTHAHTHTGFSPPLTHPCKTYP